MKNVDGTSTAPFVADGPNSYFVVYDGELYYGNCTSHGALIVCIFAGKSEDFSLLVNDLVECQSLAQIMYIDSNVTAAGILRNDGGRIIDWRLHFGFGFTTPYPMHGPIKDAIAKAFSNAPKKA